jgi:hypothetical protein
MMGWWLFKWRCFMSMVIGSEWGQVKRRHLDLADVRIKE